MSAAVKECTADNSQPFEWASVDFVSDRNSLRNLLRWVGKWRKLEDFRIDMHLVGEKTVVFTRWRTHSQRGPSPQNYGFSFEHHNTLPAPGYEVKRKAAHDRIVSYVSGDEYYMRLLGI
jgi:hypothetical protein